MFGTTGKHYNLKSNMSFRNIKRNTSTSFYSTVSLVYTILATVQSFEYNRCYFTNKFEKRTPYVNVHIC